MSTALDLRFLSLSQQGKARFFAGRDHWFEDVTDRPSPTITERPLEVVVEVLDAKIRKP